MLLLAIGALLVFMGGTDETFVLDGDFFSVKLIVVPGAGFYWLVYRTEPSLLSLFPTL